MEAQNVTELNEDEAGRQRVKFETIGEPLKIPFGKNNFLEIAKKKAITDEGVNEFISISRGYYLQDKTERFKKSVSFPNEPDIKKQLMEKIESF